MTVASVFAVLSFTISLFLGVFCLFFYSLNPYILFTSVGFFSLAIFFIPLIVEKNYDYFSPWSLTGLSILLGSTIRGIYIGFGYPDFTTLDYYFYLGQPADFFIMPAIIMIVCLMSMAIGYSYGPLSKHRSFLNLKLTSISISRLYLFAFSAFFISLFCVGLYINFTGGFDLLNLSKKRSLIQSLELSDTHRTWQSLKVIASISMLAHLFVLVDALQSKKRWKYIFAAMLFLTASFLPFYTSSRGDIVMYIIFTLSITYYVKKKLNLLNILFSCLIIVFIFQAMSFLRSAIDSSLSDAISKTQFNSSVLDRLVINRNDLELAKTAHIINSLPNPLGYQYGKTIAVWLIAPIPREIWNSKPLISSGPVIGTKIYGNERSGVPPGFIGEMFWNFHIIGIVFGGFLLGWFLRWIRYRFKPSSLYAVPIYVYGPMQAGYLIIGTSIGYGIVTISIKTVLALLVLRFLSIKKK